MCKVCTYVDMMCTPVGAEFEEQSSVVLLRVILPWRKRALTPSVQTILTR